MLRGGSGRGREGREMKWRALLGASKFLVTPLCVVSMSAASFTTVGRTVARLGGTDKTDSDARDTDAGRQTPFIIERNDARCMGDRTTLRTPPYLI